MKLLSILFLLLFLHNGFYSVKDAIDVHFSFRESGIGNAVDPSVIEHVAVHGRMPMFEHAGQARRPPMAGSVQEYRKRDMNPFPNVELVGVGNVFHDGFYRIVFPVFFMATAVAMAQIGIMASLCPMAIQFFMGRFAALLLPMILGSQHAEAENKRENEYGELSEFHFHNSLTLEVFLKSVQK